MLEVWPLISVPRLRWFATADYDAEDDKADNNLYNIDTQGSRQNVNKTRNSSW